MSRGRVVDRRPAHVVARRRRDPNGDFESAAARVVARLTCGEVLIQDDGSQNRMVDMVLTYPDGRSAAVEASTDTDKPYAEMQRHLRDSKGQFPRHWPAPELGRVWALSVSPRTPLKGLTEVLRPILKRLETAGDTFQTVADLAELPTADRAKVADLEELGIVDVSSALPAPEKALSGSTNQPSGTLPALRVDPEANAWIPVEPSWEAFLTWIAETLVSSETSMRKHLEKLAATGLVERHFFLGLTAATPDPYFSLVDQTGVPSEPPTLPAEISHVWIMDCEADRCLVRFPDRGWLDPSTVWGEDGPELVE